MRHFDLYRRKIKCDRVYPCEPCRQRNQAAHCHPAAKSEQSLVAVPTLDDFEALARRVALLEEKLVERQAPAELAQRERTAESVRNPSLVVQVPNTPAVAVPPTEIVPIAPEVSLAVAPAQASSVQPGIQAEIHEQTRPQTQDQAIQDAEDTALMLEDIAMNRRANKERVSNFKAGHPEAARSTMGALTSVLALTNLDLQSKPNISPLEHVAESVHPLADLLNLNIDFVAKLRECTPEPLQCWQLIEFYFKYLDWNARVLHEPTFKQDCKKLLFNPSSFSGKTDPAFLGVFYMVLCLALQFVRQQDKREYGLDLDPVATTKLCERMYSVAQGLLWLNDLRADHSLEHLQCVSLMGVYQYNVGLADVTWSHLGSAIKVAQNLGLSRLGDEKSNRWPPGWEDPLRREIGRRVWWQLVYLDWSCAAAHNLSYSVHPAQNLTVLPANVDDKDLAFGEPFFSKNMEQRSQSSFTICRMRLVYLYRELIDYRNAHRQLDYPFILEMDKKFMQALNELPPYFRGDIDANAPYNDPRNKEFLLLQLVGQSRFIRLHRPFLLKGYRISSYAFSKDRCVQAAKSMYNHLKSAQKACPMMLGQWIILFYGFAAAVVLFIDLCYSTGSKDSKRAILSDILEILKIGEVVSSTARRAVGVLQSLLDAESQTSHTNLGSKRKLDETLANEAFQRMVKRVVYESEASPPGRSPQSSVEPSASVPANIPNNLNSAMDNNNATSYETYPGWREASCWGARVSDMDSNALQSHTSWGEDGQSVPQNTGFESTDLAYYLTDDFFNALLAGDPSLNFGDQ